jgi:N-hydroxyarylamine O-acetyltransferase
MLGGGMLDKFDLDAYFRRIGYGGPARPDLETLSAIHARHVAAIPFENLDPLTGRPVVLDIAAVQAKLIQRRRGGYCFEQNTLLKAALETIGFRVTGLGGRVVWMSAPGAPLGPRGHMLLMVDFPDGQFLADVGFGAHLLDAPLRFAIDLEQSTPSATYQIKREGDLFALAVRQNDAWRRAYAFNLEPQLAADYSVASWFYSTHPEILFKHLLIMERLTGDARFNLLNTQLTERWRDGRVVERALSSADELAEVLDKVFDIEPPVTANDLFAKVSGSAVGGAPQP